MPYPPPSSSSRRPAFCTSRHETLGRAALANSVRERIERLFSQLWSKFIDRVYSRSWNGLWNRIKLKFLNYNFYQAGGPRPWPSLRAHD